MLWWVWLTKLLLDCINFVLKIWTPLFDHLVNEEVSWISFLNLVDISLRLGIEIKVAYLFCEVLKYHWVSHLPKGQGPSFEKFLNSEFVILEEHFRSGSVIGHCLEYGLLNVFLLDNLLVPSVKEASVLLNLLVLAILDANLEYSIRVAVESSDINVIHWQDFPLWHVLQNISVDFRNLMRLIVREFIC